jgi:hypothetical protein
LQHVRCCAAARHAHAERFGALLAGLRGADAEGCGGGGGRMKGIGRRRATAPNTSLMHVLFERHRSDAGCPTCVRAPSRAQSDPIASPRSLRSPDTATTRRSSPRVPRGARSRTLARVRGRRGAGRGLRGRRCSGYPEGRVRRTGGTSHSPTLNASSFQCTIRSVGLMRAMLRLMSDICARPPAPSGDAWRNACDPSGRVRAFVPAPCRGASAPTRGTSSGAGRPVARKRRRACHARAARVRTVHADRTARATPRVARRTLQRRGLRGLARPAAGGGTRLQ